MYVGGHRSVDRDGSSTAPIGTSKYDWKNLDQKAKRKIRLCLSDLVLLNVSEEATTKDLWDNLGKPSILW
jgi:hypothetical protein